MKYLSLPELEAGLDHILQSPQDDGELNLIVRRPRINEREVLLEGVLNLEQGLVGDSWGWRRNARTHDRKPNPEMQLNIMNARVIALIAHVKERWPLAGDQLYIDLDLSTMNLAPGMQLKLGTAIIEITPQPHTGCKKFVERFGLDAMKFVNSQLGRRLQLRGLNAKVVRPGVIRVGDRARKYCAT
jgi:hypothetical protein